MHLVEDSSAVGPVGESAATVWQAASAKPFNVDVLKVTVAKLLEMRRLREEPNDEDTRSP